MTRALFAILFSLILGTMAPAQDAPVVDRSATGGAQTLEDILARQNAVVVDDAFRSDAIGDRANAAGLTEQLGTQGGVSDPEVWRALRYGSADVTASTRGPASGVLIQDSGMWWIEYREGTLAKFATYLLGGTIVLLALFYLIRGKIRIDGAKTGRTITRFKAIERFGHWLMAGSFILLALTGLLSLFGRKVIIPLLGHDSFSMAALGSKWIHNNVSWAFMIGLTLVFFMWVLDNIPNRTDIKWLMQGGGLFKKGVHPPARKFNAGQKMIFWAVIVFGASISLSGLSLLFPFELPLFGKTFGMLNQIGIPQLVGFGELPVNLTPHAEMQYAQLWHALVSAALIAIILAHIYIGSIGMEGAYDAMGSGEVEEQWAKEHHSLWVEEVKDAQRKRSPNATPAE